MCDNSSLSAEGLILNLERERPDLLIYNLFVKGLPLSVEKVEIVGGGEPLLYRDIDSIFHVIKQKRIVGSLITNGSLLTETISQVLVRYDWEYVRISINGASRESYIKTHGVDHFSLVLNNIKALIRSRKKRQYPIINMHFVVQKDNYSDIFNFVQLANELNVDGVSFDTLIVSDHSKKLMLNSYEKKKAIDLFYKAKKEIQCSHNIDQTIKLMESYDKEYSRYEYLKNRWCPVVQKTLEIRSNGIGIPCCMAFGVAKRELNIKRASTKQIWNAYKSFRGDLKRGNFYSFCFERCNYEMPLKRINAKIH